MPMPWEPPRSGTANPGGRGRAPRRDLNPTLFSPAGLPGPAIPHLAAAKAVCGDCTVREECLAFAITTNQEFGVWGGTSEEERRVLRRQWRARQRRLRREAQAS